MDRTRMKGTSNPCKKRKLEEGSWCDYISENYKQMDLPEQAVVISITPGMLNQYSVAENRFMYKIIGQFATSLTLIDVPETDARQLLSWFINISSLTLENITITELDEYPVHLHTLKITKCIINREFLANWIPELRPTLKTLHLNGATRPIRGYDDFRELVNQFTSAGRVCELSIVKGEKSNLSIESDILRSLTIQADTLADLKLNCRGLTALRVTPRNLPNGSHPAPYYSPLEMTNFLNDLPCTETLNDLTLPTCPADMTSLVRFTNLENLTVQCRHDQTQELGHLHSFPNLSRLVIRIAAPPRNLILERLNDDCLLLIQSYLTLGDIVSLGQTHQRFKELEDRKLTADTKIDKEFVERYPPAKWEFLYTDMGRIAENLTLEGVTRDDALLVMPFFTHLDKLILSSIRFRRSDSTDKFPPDLKAFQLGEDCFIPGPLLRKLFRKWCPTLIDVDLRPLKQDLGALNDLRNIKVASISAVDFSVNIFKFLFAVGDSLERFNIDTDNIHTLEQLDIVHSLQVLKVKLKDFRIISTLKSPVEELEIVENPRCPIADIDLSHLFHLKSLKVLRLDLEKSKHLRIDDIKQLIRELPHLNTLKTRAPELPSAPGGTQLLQFLKDQKRKV